ncbi:accessory gene regulator B family protein [Paenibacillus aquistagni]|uniref:accessory gene regulator B family protein n=1 Tax=Paenibacillus aquistagni TaxID=1852522 RepID=UPI0034DF9100
MIMIEKLSRHISRDIKKSDPALSVSHEVLEYAIGIRLNFIATIFLTCMFGALTGKFLATITAMTAFIIVRKFSGGYHMKSLTLCAIVSSILFGIIPFIPIHGEYVFYLTFISSLIFLWFSPNIMEDLNPSKWDPYLKPISTMIVMSNFFINSPILALAFFAQAILIIPWKGGEST